jgi:hypothetical protein
MSDNKVEQEVKGPNISKKLVNALTTYYQPANSLADSDDTKSTQDLISEMSDMEEILPYEVNRLMEESGFIIHYDGNNYVWLLKIR